MSVERAARPLSEAELAVGHKAVTRNIARPILALLVLLIISFSLSFYAATTLHFDGLYGQDPYAYYDYGHQIQQAIADLHMPGPFYWPLGYPVVVALGFTLTGQQPLGPQMLTMLAGAAVSVLAFLLTVEVSRACGLSRRTARLAGLVAWAVIAVCGQLIQSNIVIMSDAPALFWITLSGWTLLVYGRTRHPAWIALSACALAWATMTRLQYGTLALPWALYVLLSSPIRWRHALLAAFVGLLTFTPQIVQGSQNPDVFVHHIWLEGWQVANAFGHDFTTDDGTFHYAQTPAEYDAQPLYNPYYMSLVFTALAVLGLFVIGRHSALLILLVGWFAMQYGFLIGIPYENIRFMLSFVPPLAALAGLGGAWLLTGSRLSVVARFAVILIIVAGLINTLNVSVPLLRGFVGAKNADLAAAQWIQKQIPEPNATVYCLDLLLTMQHYTTLHPVQIYEMTTETLSSQLAQTRPAYAVFNVNTTENQWLGESPWIIYHWLLDHPGLSPMGTYGNYTLYRING